MAGKRVDDEQVRALAAEDLSNREIGEAFGRSEWWARNERKRLGIPPSQVKGGGQNAKPKPATDEPVSRPTQFTLNGDEGSFSDYESKTPLTDFSDVFRMFNRDPAEFEIVGDVSLRAWQQSKRLDNGDRDTITLYSYGARFKRKQPATFTDDDLVKLSDRVNGWTLRTDTGKRDGTPVAAVLNLADMQLFKAEGGGVEATLQRLDRGLNRFGEHIDEVRKRGLNLNELVIANNGDPFEGIAGNYANQPHTVQGGLRAQMNAVLDVWLMFARELYPLFQERQFVSVLCNHTQFGRQGGAKDSITGDEDNGGAFLAETLQRVLHTDTRFQDVRFTIPHDQMNVYTTAAGIPLGFNHGHKIPASDASGFEKWLNGTVRAERAAYDVRLWITAHRHNLQMFDLGNASVLQCPSCDGGSKWLTDRTGTHANSGLASILVGEHHRLGWSDLQFL